MKLIWAVLNGPAGKRLAPFMGEIVEALERAGELQVSPEVRGKLMGVSAATIDRMLAPERARLRVKGRSGTKPGSILKRQIPIRTFAEWNEALPGFCEMDLVAHDGGDGFGEFCQTCEGSAPLSHIGSTSHVALPCPAPAPGRHWLRHLCPTRSTFWSQLIFTCAQQGQGGSRDAAGAVRG